MLFGGETGNTCIVLNKQDLNDPLKLPEVIIMWNNLLTMLFLHDKEKGYSEYIGIHLGILLVGKKHGMIWTSLSKSKVSDE